MPENIRINLDFVVKKNLNEKEKIAESLCKRQRCDVSFMHDGIKYTKVWVDEKKMRRKIRS